MPATRSSSNPPARPRWPSSAAGPTPTPSRAATSTTPSSTARRRPRSRPAGQVDPHSPARPDSTPSFRKLELPLEPPPDRAKLDERTKLTRLRGFLARTLDRAARPRRIAPHAPSPTRRRPGALATTWPWSSSPARSSSTTPCASSGRSTRSALGRRLQQRRALLHPLAADPQRGGLRGRSLDGLLRAPRRGSRPRPKT